jgi:hypothetical protein
MPARPEPWEMEAVRAILKEITDYHGIVEEEHLLHIVAMEASMQGIRPEIALPVAKSLLGKD